ncbi:MAG: hypothetical protein WC734_05580 [Patescibacteria group bacterium]|jgi:hypothetical protein
MERINYPNPREAESMGIEAAASFEGLYSILRTMLEVVGTAKTYTPDELITKIEDVRRGDRDISFITRSHGLRNTVERLLTNEQTD